MFDIFYMGDNPALVEDYPFAKQVTDISQVKATTKMFWFVEPNIEISATNILSYRPPEYDQNYTHVWKWNSQNYGGLWLYPVNPSAGTKEINQVVCRKKFDILRTENPGTYFDEHPHASHVWCIDPEYKLNRDIDWAPGNFEPNFIHSFHLRGQLDHKYPDVEGGVKLYPRNWTECSIKFHRFLDAGVAYPVRYVKDVEDYTQRDIYTDEYVWLIDSDHRVNAKTLDWVPSPFEAGMIHSFRMTYQLTERYPMAMGGIRLVPTNWHDAATKIHKDCPIEDENYDVFYVNDDEFTEETYQDLAARAKTDWFWVVDRDFDFNGKLLYVPAEHEQEYIHVFKIPGHLEERYPLDVTEYWDNRISGVRLVNKNFDITKHKYQESVCPVRYDVFFTDNIQDYETYSRKSRTKMFWLIDSDHDIDTQFNYLPHRYDQKAIHIFKVPDQLTHKYPADITNVSDNRCGGLKLVPVDYKSATVKFVSTAPAKSKSYPKVVVDQYVENDPLVIAAMNEFDSNWCWVIESSVMVSDDFTYNFVPDVWDAGKVHVWQKLNPVTGMQYDYGGVYLVPLEKKPGRPKYVREPASTQQPFPVLELEPSDIVEQLVKFSKKCKTPMFYALDPFVTVDSDFNYSYYPTQWDMDNVHVFLSTDDTYRGVRLYPVDTFIEKEYTISEVQNNSFSNLKKISMIASSPTVWPLVYLTSLTRQTVVDAILDNNSEYIFTLDPDVFIYDHVVKNGFIPDVSNLDKVHVWQRMANGKIHSYGGLRLWPTSIDVSKITTETALYTNIKNIHYVREPGCTYGFYDVIFISYHESNAEARFQALSELLVKRYGDNIKCKWVRDVEGIFNAHKEAAKLAETKMFWVVDADAEVVDNFDFGYVPDQYDQDVVHVWNSRNPITGAEYGYGGVKLFNRAQVLAVDSWGLDFTTGLSNRFKVMPELSCVTRFNTDAFSTWRSAFRECVKLSLNNDAESKERLQGWLHPVPDAEFRHDAKRGAEEGVAFAAQHQDNTRELAKINDFAWLKEKYESQH